MAWNHRVKIRHLFTEEEDHESVQKSMSEIKKVLDESRLFYSFDTSKFDSIPAGDEVIRPVDYANKLLDKMYDYADYKRIWIE